MVELTENLRSRCQKISVAGAVVALSIGAIGLTGWILKNDLLKRLHPSLVTVKANTAVCLMLAAVSLLLLQDESTVGVRRRIAQACAVMIVLVGLLTLSEHISGWALGIDQILFQESLAEAGQSFPGRMGVAGSLNFCFLGTALLLLDAKDDRKRWVSSFSVLAALIVTLLVFLYYFYGIEQFEPIALYATIALHTVVAFVTLCAGILFARPTRGVMATLLEDSAGSLVARRMLPALLLIALLGWLRMIGRNSGLFGAGFGTASFALLMMLVFAALIWWTALSLNRIDKQRRQAEAALLSVALFPAQNPEPVLRVDQNGVLLYLNEAARAAFENLRLNEPVPDFIQQLAHLAAESKENYQLELPIGHRHFLVTVAVVDEPYINLYWRDITDRKQTEKTLAEKEADLEIVVNRTPFLLTRCGRDLRYKFVSNAYARMVDRTPDELKGRLIAEVVGETGWKTILPYVERVLRGEQVQYETDVHFADIGLRSLRVVYIPDRNPEGEVTGWVASILDVSDQKRAEHALRLLGTVSDLTRTLKDPVELCFAVAEAVGTHLHLKRCLFNETDLAQDLEVVYRDYCDGVESVAGRHKLSEYSGVTSGEMSQGQTVINCDSKIDFRTAGDYQRTYEPTGERAYVAVPLLREGNWVATLWVSDNHPRKWSVEEITLLETVAERTWAAIEGLRIDAALRESEERLRLATAAAEMCSWEFDLSAGTAVFSENAGEVLGFNPSSQLDRSIHADDYERVLRIFQDAAATKDNFNVEYRLVDLETANEVWVFSAGQGVARSDKEVKQLVGVSQNITKRKLSEEERERLLNSEHQARDAAEDANRLKDEFLATLSHELRNPLNVVVGYSEYLLRAPEISESPQLRKISESLKRNALAQSQLINDLLDLSRLQLGKFSLEKETVSLSVVLNNAVETIRNDASGKNIAVNVSIPEDVFFVSGDPLRLQQIAWNLLNNAVKFTPAEGSIEIRLTHAGGKAVLTVEDTGRGIDPAFLPHVFEMFRQADSGAGRRQGGMGIGLALVKQLVELHGGTVSVESRGLGEGSRFMISLPLTNEGKAVVPLEERAPEQQRLAGVELLVVDDSEDTLEMLSKLLLMEGANVVTASSAKEALEYAIANKFDVILSDISMPGMDGFEFIKELREIPGQKNLPVLALTGFGRTEDIERVRAAGFHSHFVKPLELDGLILMIEVLCRPAHRRTLLIDRENQDLGLGAISSSDLEN